MKGSVRKRGKTWSYIIDIGKIDGKRKQKEKGGFRTKKDAETACRKAIDELENTGKIFKETKVTLEEYIDYWYKTVAVHQLKYNTLDLYKRAIKNHIKPKLGHLFINQINPAILQKLLSDITSSHSNSMLNCIKNILNGTFKLGVKQSVIKINPMLGVESRRKPENKKIRVLSKSEINTVLEDVQDSRYFIPILISLHTGARLGEVLGLLWSNINFDTRIITIENSLQWQNKELVRVSPKTKSSIRKIMMTTYLEKELITWKEQQRANEAYYNGYYYDGEHFVCTNEDGSPINPKRLSTQMTRMSKRLGIDFKFHDLRHTHATLMLEADVNVKVIQERLGHANINTTLGVYSHVTRHMEDEAVKRFDSIFK
ncbi:Transposase from transposon Tn916 [Bacillus subtilis]|nr:Transposase from transposon Tn916 [Bacillus subtilis]